MRKSFNNKLSFFLVSGFFEMIHFLIFLDSIFSLHFDIPFAHNQRIILVILIIHVITIKGRRIIVVSPISFSMPVQYLSVESCRKEKAVRRES